MNKKIKKILGLSSIGLVIFSVISTVFASSYLTSYYFSTSMQGPTRYFDGTNIRFISPNTTSTPSKHTLNFNYSVSLYRDKFIDDYIGIVILNRDSYGVANWTNVGSGNYYVFLDKDFDGIYLVDNNVTIQNY